MLNILITGGAGFIGSNIAHRLSDHHHVTVCDRFRSGEKWRNLAGVGLASVVLPEDLAAALERHVYDVIVHMGAISATTELDADLVVRTNVVLSERLLDYCASRGARLIYASSAATYGEGDLGFEDDASLGALAALRPLNPYGWSKALFDQMVVRRAQHGGPLPAQWVGLKFFNVFGPREDHKGSMRSVVHKVHGQISAGQPVTLFKSYREDIPDGGQRRDFVYVMDCVSIVEWLVDNPHVSGLFNVGTGQARSFHDLAQAVFSAMGSEPRIEFVEMPAIFRKRYQYFTQAAMQKLRRAGYSKPSTSLEDSIIEYVQTFLTPRWHEQGLDSELARTQAQAAEN